MYREMSGDVHRSMSYFETTPGGGYASPAVARKLGNGRLSPTSPLKLFGQAKKKINAIFVDIEAYIKEGLLFVEGLDGDSEELMKYDQRETLERYIDKVTGIREILSRDRMKVAFFGRTSNGKSSVINAMLRNRILPSGIGHTTNCFLQVEGTDGQEAFIITEHSPDERKSIQSISQLASALSKFKLDANTLIRICWPKDKCTLLRDDVVFVDSPGIDVSPDIDSWIDKFCLDADVFVLVANAESTLMQTEKNFFHRVSERLSKPNIFILNNRWDASASELETMQEVKQQHTERCVEFLVDELKVVPSADAEHRVFFVSAREALVSRVNQDQGTPTPSGALLDGFQSRLFEFANFEHKFEETISQSAVETKFAQHTANGHQITRDLHAIMEGICEAATSCREKCHEDFEDKQSRLDYTEKQLSVLSFDIKEKIRDMTEEVEQKVASALTDEIRRLSILVDEFDRPFHPDQLILNVYKKELPCHLEECISRNLHARCNTFVSHAMDCIEEDIRERLMSLVPEESSRGSNAKYSSGVSFAPSGSFAMAYRLDCRNLCADFCEDIEFRFSFGISALMRRFMGSRGGRKMTRGYSEIPRSMSYTPQTPTNHAVAMEPENELAVAVLTTFSSLYSGTTVGAMALAALLGKAIGWKVIVVAGTVYGLLYIYERLTWTNKAKERAFKRQYVEYASSKLRLIVDLTSANCSHQVQQELSSTFSRLVHEVDLTKSDLQTELDDLQQTISRLEAHASKAHVLKNKAQFIETELDKFFSQFLKAPDSKL